MDLGAWLATYCTPHTVHCALFTARLSTACLSTACLSTASLFTACLAIFGLEGLDGPEATEHAVDHHADTAAEGLALLHAVRREHLKVVVRASSERI